MPAAYLITYSTYGSHHQGDERGSFRARAVVQRPNERLVAYRRSLMQGAPVSLDAAMREVVLRAIVATCGFRPWTLEAAHVRTEHVHAVVRAEEPPEAVMASCKAWSTRYLRVAGLVDADARVWTRHGSTRWLWSESEVSLAAEYVYARQGEPMSRYP